MKSVLHQELMLSKGVYQIRMNNDSLGLPFSQKHQFFVSLVAASSIERETRMDGLRIAALGSCVPVVLGEQFYKFSVLYNNKKQIVGFTIDYVPQQEGIEETRLTFEDKATFQLMAALTDEDFKILIKGMMYIAQKQTQMLMDISKHVS